MRPCLKRIKPMPNVPLAHFGVYHYQSVIIFTRWHTLILDTQSCDRAVRKWKRPECCRTSLLRSESLCDAGSPTIWHKDCIFSRSLFRSQSGQSQLVTVLWVFMLSKSRRLLTNMRNTIQDYNSFSVQLTTYIVWAFPIRKTKPYNHLSPSWRLQN